MDLPRYLHILTFQNTSLIKNLTILFQKSDPTLSMMPVIWKSMCLAAYMRKSDEQHLLQSMEMNSKNQMFLQTLANCFIHQKIESVEPTSTKKITKPHLDSLCELDELTCSLLESLKMEGEEYPFYWNLTSSSNEISSLESK